MFFLMSLKVQKEIRCRFDITKVLPGRSFLSHKTYKFLIKNPHDFWLSIYIKSIKVRFIRTILFLGTPKHNPKQKGS